MAATPNLGLAYIEAAQAQKHVTHNEAIRNLDALVQLGVLDRNLTAPPVTPTEGDRYIVAAGATGAWATYDNEVAAWQDGAWMFYPPQEGWLCWVGDEDVLVAWDGTAWVGTGSGGGGSTSLNPATGGLVGVNATADVTNRLSVNAPATLFNHEGAGHQLKLNKNLATDTVSLLYQTGFSGRAELGLTGDDDFHLKVSADGTAWKNAIDINRTTGEVTFPNTVIGGGGGGGASPNLLINGSFNINQRVFAGGTLSAGLYGYDRWKAGASGANVSVSSGTVTLASGEIVQVVEAPDLAGQSVTLSVEDLTGGDLNIDIEGQTGGITAGAGRKGATLTVPVTSTGNVSVSLSPASGSVTFKRVKLETGITATNYHSQLISQDLAQCQRYYFKTYNQTAAPGTATTTGYTTVRAPTSDRPVLQRDLPVSMRSGASLTMYSPNSGTAGKLYDENGAVDVDGSINTIAETTLAVHTSNTVTIGHNFTVHLVADAEL